MARRHYSDEERALVYGLRAVDSDQYFYVGSTKRPVAVRLRQHLDPVNLRRNRNTHFVRKVSKIGRDRVTADVLETTTADARFVREYAWIADLLGRGVRLTNLVTRLESYVTRRKQDEYIEKVTDPRYLLEGIVILLYGSDQAADPRDQEMFVRFKLVALKILAHWMRNWPDEFRAHFAGLTT